MTATDEGHQIHAECIQRAMQMLNERLAEEGGPPLTEDEQLSIEVGIAAGVAATLLVLGEKGYIQ